MPVSEHTFGRIVVDSGTCTSGVIITPERVNNAGRRREGRSLHVGDLDQIVSAGPDMLIIGTDGLLRPHAGPGKGQGLPAAERHSDPVSENRRSGPVRMFNQLHKEFARIVAVLHLTG